MRRCRSRRFTTHEGKITNQSSYAEIRKTSDDYGVASNALFCVLLFRDDYSVQFRWSVAFGGNIFFRVADLCVCTVLVPKGQRLSENISVWSFITDPSPALDVFYTDDVIESDRMARDGNWRNDRILYWHT